MGADEGTRTPNRPITRSVKAVLGHVRCTLERSNVQFRGHVCQAATRLRDY